MRAYTTKTVRQQLYYVAFFWLSKYIFIFIKVCEGDVSTTIYRQEKIQEAGAEGNYNTRKSYN